MKMKKKSSGGGSNWMDTYGDMVTLLLCFFVLLYSISSIDQDKWIKLVQSFNPEAIPSQTEIIDGTKGQISDEEGGPTQEEIDQSIQQLYEKMLTFVQQQGAGDNISVTKGDGYIFISLDNAVFFDGDSHVLRQEGKAVLDDVGMILADSADAIDEIRILGHTAQAVADRPNNVMADRMLASNRATVVLVYLQEQNFIDPARLVSMGYGQWRPKSGNEDPDERARNRRVELIVSARNIENGLQDSIARYYTDAGIAPPQNQDITSQDDPTPLSDTTGQSDSSIQDTN